MSCRDSPCREFLLKSIGMWEEPRIMRLLLARYRGR
jgi:hypothetical protein